MAIGSRERVVARPEPMRLAARGGAGDGGRRRPPTPTMRRRRRRAVTFLLVIGVVVVLLASAAYAVSQVIQSVTPSCTAAIGSESYRIDHEQADNARTIADVATRMGMPHHAVTIALAAALQESELHNISHGDRDSVGLFQQRPSQGWGTPSQLTTPTFAAAAFYRELAKVDGWDAMTVTDAAQHVQRSAAPGAYADWEPEARVLARILTGEVPDRITCS